MKLQLYRLLETLFAIPAAYFGDLADELDTDLHDVLREAMKDIEYRKMQELRRKIEE